MKSDERRQFRGDNSGGPVKRNFGRRLLLHASTPADLAPWCFSLVARIEAGAPSVSIQKQIKSAGPAYREFTVMERQGSLCARRLEVHAHSLGDGTP